MKALTKVFILFLLSGFLYADAFMKGDFADIDYLNQIWALRQNVSLRTQKYQMTSDEMTFYRKDKRFFAKGNVYLFFNKENRKVWAASLNKDSVQKMLQGTPLKVIDKNDEREITALNLILRDDTKEKILVFENNVKLKENKLQIQSSRLVYNEDTGEIQLEKESILEKPEEKLKIQSKDIQYNEKLKKAVFSNPVHITKKESEITAEKGYYEEKDDLIFLEDGVIYREKKREVKAHRMTTRIEKDEKIMSFEDIIQIQEDNFIGKCLVLEYMDKKEYVNLKGNAALRDEKKNLGIKSSLISVDKKKDMIYFIGAVYVTQKNKVITGNIGVYNKKNGILEVKGNAIYKRGKDLARAEKVYLNTDTNEVRMYGNLKGIFKTGSKTKGETVK